MAELPQDAVEACLAANADRPVDVVRRARALGEIEPSVRALAGEVFKRAANIAKDAPDGQPLAPDQVEANVHASEVRLFNAFGELDQTLELARSRGEYAQALGAIAEFAPVLAQYYKDVFVMVDDPRIRGNRLRLMRQIHRRCSTLADFNLLAVK
jgi:glycyl-tRNA synthetase beta chain